MPKWPPVAHAINSPQPTHRRMPFVTITPLRSVHSQPECSHVEVTTNKLQHMMQCCGCVRFNNDHDANILQKPQYCWRCANSAMLRETETEEKRERHGQGRGKKRKEREKEKERETDKEKKRQRNRERVKKKKAFVVFISVLPLSCFCTTEKPRRRPTMRSGHVLIFTLLFLPFLFGRAEWIA